MRLLAGAIVVTFAVLLVSGAAYAAAAAGPKTAGETKATVMGKVEVKTEKLANKEVKVAYITVTNAQSADGKALSALQGKTLKVMGPKAMDIEKLAGKEVAITGMVKGNTIQATQLMEKKTTGAAPMGAPAPGGPAPAPTAPPAPAPAPAPK